MKVIGLTGGIGMGKSTAAATFRRAHIPVFDADAEVHALQAPGGRALPAIAQAFPSAMRSDASGRPALDRAALRAIVLADPLVRAAERRFIARSRRAGARAAVLDVPLLLEADEPRWLDLTVVVSAPRAVQMFRVRKRRRLTNDQINAVIARQMPDREKRRRADVVVRTGLSRHHAQRTLRRLIKGLLA
jgi:dephospho-CoA kinase